jgi:hypothetical protein
MQGLRLKLPRNGNLVPGVYDLTVVTTYGTDVLRGGVALYRDVDAPAGSPPQTPLSPPEMGN